MKELFGTNETENRKNTECDGAKYCTLNIGHGISDEINKTAEKLERIEEKGKLPFALYIVAWILFGTGFNIAGLFVVDILFDGFDSIKSVIGFFIGGVISLVIGGGMLLYEKYKTQANIGSKEYKKANDDLEKRISIYTAQLGIPSDAEKINVFLYNYKIKNGETVIKEEFTGHFINYEAYVFNEAECLCISDLEYRFDIPLSDIKDFGVEEKTSYASGWTKDKSPSEYGIKTDNLERIMLKTRAYMLFDLGGEEFRMYFPEYEMPVLKRLAGRE